eukprot:TRINITY_DN696_c0_g5_i1.p1 TRINITY_DN696_c0_g5~~TRINITY_DN696_c0_g5_i1.p1  ORF type:complete len:114 (-),score=4.72 TRINITY_DN696_c0_g5_i1:230-571(-)
MPSLVGSEMCIRDRKYSFLLDMIIVTSLNRLPLTQNWNLSISVFSSLANSTALTSTWSGRSCGFGISFFLLFVPVRRGVFLGERFFCPQDAERRCFQLHPEHISSLTRGHLDR